MAWPLRRRFNFTGQLTRLARGGGARAMTRAIVQVHAWVRRPLSPKCLAFLGGQYGSVVDAQINRMSVALDPLSEAQSSRCHVESDEHQGIHDEGQHGEQNRQ